MPEVALELKRVWHPWSRLSCHDANWRKHAESKAVV